MTPWSGINFTVFSGQDTSTLHGLAGQNRGDGPLLEGHGEPTVELREWQGHAQHTMLRASSSRHRDMQEGLGLPHVQVTDHPLVTVAFN